MQVKLKITETFERIVTVEAEDKSDAVVKATNEYVLNGEGTLEDQGLVYFNVEICEEN